MLDCRVVDESTRQKARAVQQMFGEIAPRYDLLNRLLSAGIDRRWRLAAVKVALQRNPQRILDLACGTGDMALWLKRLAPQAEVVGGDFAEPMLQIARQKAKQAGLELPFQTADALALPFPDQSFDAITIAFGFRNFADYPCALNEIFRVLSPGGRVCILEFPPPPEGLLGGLYRFYFVQVLPLIGGWISGKPRAYRYLPDSVERFPTPARFRDMMEQASFAPVRFMLFSGGIAALHVGEKPAS